MKSLTFGLSLLVFQLSSSIALADAEAMSQQLPGKWKHEHRQLGVSADTFKIYAEDGTFKATSKIKMIGVDTAVVYEGTWKFVNDTTLRLEVNKSSNGLFVADDAVYVLKGVKIKDGVMTYKHDGDANKEVRLKDQG